jgi:outer membrane receptor protein involved in Fe transport
MLLNASVVLCFTARAQTHFHGNLTGKVTDAQTGEVLPGANVQIVGTVLGNATDAEGIFVIKKLQPGVYTMRVSYIGYDLAHASAAVFADSTSRVNFALQPALLEGAQVVVTATRQVEETKTAVVSVSTLTNESAMRRQPLRVDAALESIPGVNMVGENVNVRNSTGYTRGLGSRVLILIDGVPALPSDFGNMNWDILPVTDFEHIEVIKGPSSAIYGSYALGGVINIITKPPRPEGRLAVRVSGGIYDEPYQQEWQWTDRTLNFNRQDLSYSRQIGKMGLRLSLGRHESTGDRENRHFQRWNGTAKLDFRFSEAWDLTLFGAYARDRRGEFVWGENGRPFVVPLAFKDYRLALDAYTGYARARYRVKDWLELSLRASLVRQLTSNQFRIEGDFEPAQGPGADFHVYARLDSNFSFTTGLDYRYDFAEQRQIGQHFAYTLSPYFQTIWQAHRRWRVTLGVRYDHYYLLPGPEVFTKKVYNPIKEREELITVVNPLPQGLEEQQLSPQVGVSFQIAESSVLHSAVGHGIRIPALGERFLQFDQPIPFRPNPGIVTEESWSYELGWRQRFSAHADLEVVGFYSLFDDLIEPVFVASGTSFYATLVNIAQARIPGVEVSTRLRFWRNRLGLDASATWTDATITKAGESTVVPVTFQDGDPLTYRPDFIAYVTPSLHLGAFSLEADYSYASTVAVQLFINDQRVPKKQLDARLLYNWSNLTLQFAVRNVLQYYYAQVERNLNEVRSFSMGLMWEY